MKSVLVTGGTTRLGRVIAERLRADGWRVLTSSHRADAGADIVADFRETLGAAKCYAAAIRILDGEPPTALVNNAALFVGDDATLEAVNLTAPMKLTMMMAGRETGRGSVVNILDANTARVGKYAQTKQSLREYTVKSAAMFVDTIRVNAVSPGSLKGLSPTEVHEPAAPCSLGRPKPDDVADAVAFLLSNPSVTALDIPIGASH